MRLVRVEVSRFKSVTGAAEFAVDDAVTALVGKNESGKTAVLQAMYRLNPLASGHATDFEELRDYPRRYRSRDRAKIAEARPIRMTFHLDAEDIGAIEVALGSGALRHETVTVVKAYAESHVRWAGTLADERAVARHLVAKAGLDPERYVKSDLASTIETLQADADAPAAPRLAEELSGVDVQQQMRSELAKRLPRFQYFDEYNILPGRVSVTRLQTIPEDELAPGERTALSLLRLAGVESEEFSEQEYEPRKAALEAAANQLTDELFDYWSQNQDLAVELDIEFQPVPAQPGTSEAWLQIRVRNNRHRVTLNMAERSKGFVWFFSFLAAFSEYADEDRRIVLLDEPGMSLHARAQNDLLRYIEEQVAPYHQVVYSTHSLFMIDPQRLERCRTVEDLDNVGTMVSEEVWSARPETVFPLLGALGVDMSQTLIIGPDQLLLEGPSDMVYLNLMSQAVVAAGGRGLDPHWTLTPVGGLDKVPTFIALLGGSDLNVTVLLDVAAGGNQRIDNLVARGLLENRRLVPLTDITGGTEADIEDLFDPQWYLKLLAASGVGKVPRSKLTGGRIVKQVEAALGSKYDHFAPAGHLLRSPGTFLDDIDADTRARFQGLFDRLNALLSN